MELFGNLLWLLFGGLLSSLSWCLCGCLWCLSIIGIPIGIQCFKMAGLCFAPFGKEVIYSGNGFSFLVNLLWLLISGIWLALEFVVIGGLLSITIIGIPFGLQMFKLAKLALMPFGAEVV